MSKGTKGFCYRCGFERILRRNKLNGRLMCRSCRELGVCRGCGNWAKVEQSRCGPPRCLFCARHNPKTFRECSDCGKNRPVEKWLGERPVCKTCTRRPGFCLTCRAEAPNIAARFLCPRHYQAERRAAQRSGLVCEEVRVAY